MNANAPRSAGFPKTPGRSPSAAIVNTCSIAATAGLPQRALYGATKGAVQALTLAMAMDHLADAGFGPFKISVVGTRQNVPQLDAFLRQAPGESADPEDTWTRLAAIVPADVLRGTP